MTAVQLPFRDNAGKYSFIGTPELVNCYAEKTGQDAKGPLAIVPADGLVEFTMNGDTPCRGLLYMEDLDKLYDIRSSAAYRVTFDGTDATSTRIGTVPGIDTVQLSRNQKADPQLVVQAAAGLQVIESDSASYVLDTDLPTPVITADYSTGRHLYGLADRRFFWSDINLAKQIDALNFATFEQRAGKLRRIVEHAGEVVGFCSTWMEFWRGSGDADAPFQPIANKPRGLKSPFAVAASNNTLFFVGDDNNINQLNNYDPVIIESPEVSRLIQEDPNPETISAFSYEREGHSFVVFTGTGWTRVYDAATGTFHTRKSYGQDIWRVNHIVKAWGKTLAGDRRSGKLFELKSGVFSEDGEVMEWKVVSPPMHAFPNGGIIDAIHFDLGTGYGTLSGQGSDPKVMLRVSKDGGNTFDQYRELELGVRGKTATRVTARRLGQFGPKGAVFELSITDPVVRALVNVDAEVRPLKR